MALTPRPRPYLYVTWIAGLLSGGAHCYWAAWLKAHHQYEKVQDGNSDQLSKWIAQHDRVVLARVKELKKQGWRVTIEAQNKFTLRGELGDVAGKVDYIADKADAVLFGDVKTGKPKPDHVWQVREYMTFFGLADKARVSGKRILGEVVYKDHTVSVTCDPSEREHISAEAKRALGPAEPKTTPSQADCRYCDIADCPDRFTGESLSGSAAGLF